VSLQPGLWHGLSSIALISAKPLGFVSNHHLPVQNLAGVPQLVHVGVSKHSHTPLVYLPTQASHSGCPLNVLSKSIFSPVSPITPAILQGPF
jgi:hypothetical protein